MTATPTQRRLIGSDPNQVPLNGMLGRMAFLDPVELPEIEARQVSTPLLLADLGEFQAYALTDGTESTPALFFSGDVDLGVYRPAPNTWGIVAGGLTQVTISDAISPVEERYLDRFYPIVSAVDIGEGFDQLSLNWSLGLLAFQDVIDALPASQNEPQDEREVNFEFVSNTELKIRMRGDDGVVRSTTLTLS
jgi:hypothetical protein